VPSLRSLSPDDVKPIPYLLENIAMAHFRSLLFVPGSHPDRFEGAIRSGADAVCIDLEDSVAPQLKGDARTSAATYLNTMSSGQVPVGVRINVDGSAWRDADLSAVGQAADFIMVPKTESPDELQGIAGILGRQNILFPIIETAEGLRCAWEVAAASNVMAVLFGGFDYSVDVGCTMDWEPLLFARSMLAAACARGGVALLDVPSADLGATEMLRESTLRSKELGFSGRACIHPDQVQIVNNAYTPTPEEVGKARRIVDAFEEAGGGAAQLDGRLLELPVARSARRVLAAATSARLKSTPHRP
jgi:(S)-citramalyl-CoA lyase